jgi:hypothetical protein
MPESPIKDRWIAVTRRSSDGRYFAGNVAVTIEPGQVRDGPWRLSLETVSVSGWRSAPCRKGSPRN